MQHINATQHTLCPSLLCRYFWISRYLNCKKQLTCFKDFCLNDCACRMVSFISLRHLTWQNFALCIIFFAQTEGNKSKRIHLAWEFESLVEPFPPRESWLLSWTSCKVSHLVTPFSHNRPEFSFLHGT